MSRVSRLYVLSLGVVLLYCGSSVSAEDFRVRILRRNPDVKCTSGYLDVNGRITAYTLERPWKDNQRNVSSIPAGTYKGILRYDHNDHWRIELQGVKDRENVQIHIGNEPEETKGCVLVGSGITKDLCRLTDSAGAYRNLKNAFYGSENPIATPNKEIAVTIE